MRPDRYAIVGYGFRLPGGVHTADGFWQLLSERGFVREPVASRYGRGYEPVLGEPGPSRLGAAYEGLMRGDEPYLFDCRLFGMSAREASVMDPQIRMLLTCTWEALEQAGWDQARLRNSRTGVFVGAQVSSSGSWQPPHGPNEYMVTGTSLDMLPNRISYAFNLMGPSATYMTACSSGATAMHAAVTALAAGDCDQAIVGAATYLGSARASAAFAELGVISPDGGCRSFDATANGYMRSEGVFVYLVKPLAAAEADGDRVLAVITGTAVNAAGAADGATGSGPGRMITAPTQHAQAELMRAACARAGLSPDEVDYIEAHATGTRVGDRIEGNAIREVFGGPDRQVPLRVASVKSNLGHMEAAAFTCALLKVLLMFERRAYAPVSRHFAVPNPDIDFAGLRVQTEMEPFGERPVVVGINSFGFGGANGHCLLEEYRPRQRPASPLPAPEAEDDQDPAYLVPLSARTPEALRESARALGELVVAGPPFDLRTLAGNLGRRRTHFPARAAFAATGMADLASQLGQFAEETEPPAVVAEAKGEPRVLMVFAGQGTQWAGCGRELYATEPVFRQTIDAVDAAWRGHAGFSLRDECFGAPQSRLDECRLAQPVIFMIEAALTDLLASWGVRPACVAGHSAGEVAAAYAAGIYSLAEATRLIYHRTVQQQRTAGSGRMLAVTLDRAGAESVLRELGTSTLDIACENAPASTVLCGSQADVERAMTLLAERGVQNRLLRGNVAFHSSAMDPIETDLRDALAFLDSLDMRARVPFISSVTGEVTEHLDAAYWWSNVRRPVRFAAAVAVAAREFRPDLVIEVAPHTALLSAVQQCYDGAAAAPACVPTLTRGADSRLSFCQALAALYREGADLDFQARYPDLRPVTHLLPPYPAEPRPVIDPMVDDTHFMRRGEYSAGPLLGRWIAGPQPRFEVRMSAADFPWLADHRVQNTALMPAAGYIEMILEAMGNAPVYFPVIEFLKPCLLAGDPVRLQTELTQEPGPGDAFSFRISSIPYSADDSSAAVLHCSGKVRRLAEAPAGPDLPELDRARFAAGRLNSRKAFYGHMDAVIGESFQYGPQFQVVHDVREDMATKELLLDVRMDGTLWRDGQRAGYRFPPALLDGGLQSFILYLMECSDISAVPRRMEGLTIGRLPTSSRLTCHFVPRPDRSAWHERGQLSLPLGEWPAGGMTLYDAASGDRVAHMASYTSAHANPKRNVADRGRHVIRLYPKFADTDLADGLATALAGTLASGGPLTPNALGTLDGLIVAEFAQSAEPERTAVVGYLVGEDDKAPEGPEFWLLGASAADTERLAGAFGRPGGPAVRFATADLTAPDTIDFDDGLLRQAACHLLIVDAATAELTAEAWSVIRRLLVPGGLALVRHPDTAPAPPGSGWTRLGEGERSVLWAAPPGLWDDASTDGPDDRPADAREAGPESPRWLFAAAGPLADLWALELASGAKRVAMESLDSRWPWSNRVQQEMRGLHAVDFFCAEEDRGDPLGERLLRRFLEFIRAMAAAREQAPGETASDAAALCRVTVISRRAAFGVLEPRAAALWGAVRSLGHELGRGLRLDLRLVDIGESGDLAALRWLDRHDVHECELAIREGQLYAPRLVSLPRAYSIPASQAGRYQLSVTTPGQISGLSMRTEPDQPPGPHEVEIDVAVAALNFRDIMVALDLLPSAAYEKSALGRQIGIEASGIVRRVGSAVTRYLPGDPVVFMRGGCVASRVTTDESVVFAMPAVLSMAQAAAVPSAYVTAYHALIDLARLRAGQRVLIHSAMGGVGQAAIALARHTGATVYATAGTPEKRRKLLGFGVTAAFDSRSFRWHDDLLEATGGEGVDVVLNSLAGHHIALCLQALRPGGWHCEIGKVDIYSDTALGMSVFRKNLRFAAIDVDRLMHEDPDHCRELTTACLLLLADGTLPPLPVTRYPYAEYESALRLMASGQHEGKLVLVAPDAAEARELAVDDRRPFLDPDATYLVTGGLGGLGLRLVAYLVSAGARHLTLLDRDPARRRDSDWVRNASGIAHYFPTEDVRIDIEPADVARRADVDRVIAGLARPLKGVFHLAAVLDDHALADITPESVATVFAAKAGGAWHLHQATRELRLDHFVLLSSVSSVVGNAGQSVYAGANAFLDALAACRHRQGLPGLAYNMAGVAEAGMAARSPKMLRFMRAAGIPAVSMAVAIANLDYALRAMPGQDHLVGADIRRLPGGPSHPDFMRTGRWMADGDIGTGEQGLSPEAVADELCREISKLSGHDQVGPQETIASFGVSSVSIAELSAFVRTRYNYQVGILDLMTTATPESIAVAITRGGAPDREAEEPGNVATTRSEHDKSMPADCQQDLESLQETIRALAGGSAPVPADRFRAVFLTGATGFVGRFTLVELLRQSDEVMVHCLVRAGDEAEGMDRVRRALRDAEIWDDAFSSRIRIWPGDIREPRFGLPEEDFTRLCEEIDAVYHLAADLSLMSPYAALREANTQSFRNVLELALLRRTKHIVYASTMGVFPQYFCNFAGEFAGQPIDDAAQPDLGQMKAVLPPGLIGYPWSKLVVEKALLFGHALGLPVAIMRLPQMGIAASTGFTQSTDIKVRVVTAVLDARVMPAGFRLHWTEPADTVSETLVKISLNPDRRHTVYHLCNAEPRDHGLELADFGVDAREVSYADFRRACQARGPHGPLHGYWPLVDHFADLWFPAQAADRPATVPVSVTAVQADLTRRPAASPAGHAPEWPGLITTTARSFGWVTRHADDWPYRPPAARLSEAALRRHAERLAERLAVRFDVVYPPVLLDGLDRLVGALRDPAARIREDRHSAIRFALGRNLWNRASLAREYDRNPAIADERVERPVFILGINRTGTTLLHRLLAQGSRFWAPWVHEIAHPALSADGTDDARRAFAHDALAASGTAEAMRGIHSVDTGEPEEDFTFLEDSFAAWTYTLRYHVPAYGQWLSGVPSDFAYGAHRRTMQHLTWQRGTRLGADKRQWLLKMPFHLAELEMLAATYPDAVFIQTHREPRDFMGSWCSFTQAARSLSAHAPDKAALATLGAGQLDFMSRMLERTAQLRSQSPELDQRFVDVSYLDLVEAPVRVAEEVYRQFGWEFDRETSALTERWHARQARQRQVQPRHRYTLGTYGLTARQVDEAFSRYAEFASVNKIRMK